MDDQHLTFSVWFNRKLLEQNMGVRETARQLKVAHPVVCEALAGQKPSVNFLKKVAGLFEESEEDLLRMAGILAPRQGDDELAALVRKITKLPHVDQAEIIAFIRKKQHQREGNAALQQ